MADDEKINLRSNDAEGEAKSFTVSKKAMEISVTIKNLVEEFGEEGMEIPLPNVSGPILEKVIEYCNYKLEHPDPDADKRTEAEKRAAEIPEWERNFCDVEQPVLFNMILAANYLDIKPLLDLTCKTVANMIKGKTPDQIKALFGVTRDFTPEEEEQVRKENPWLVDNK